MLLLLLLLLLIRPPPTPPTSKTGAGGAFCDWPRRSCAAPPRLPPTNCNGGREPASGRLGPCTSSAATCCCCCCCSESDRGLDLPHRRRGCNRRRRRAENSSCGGAQKVESLRQCKPCVVRLSSRAQQVCVPTLLDGRARASFRLCEAAEHCSTTATASKHSITAIAALPVLADICHRGGRRRSGCIGAVLRRK